FFIHIDTSRGAACTNSMPEPASRSRTYIRPCAWRSGVSATHTSKRCTRSPEVISTLARGKASRSSSPVSAFASTARSAAAASNGERAAERDRRISACMAFRTCERALALYIDLPREIEARHEQSLVALQRGRRFGAEAARLDPPAARPAAERAGALLGE